MESVPENVDQCKLSCAELLNMRESERERVKKGGTCEVDLPTSKRANLHVFSRKTGNHIPNLEILKMLLLYGEKYSPSIRGLDFVSC